MSRQAGKMSFVKRPDLILMLIAIALVVAGCTVSMDQPIEITATSPPNTPAISATPIFPTTQLPVAWTQLHLTGKLIYLTSSADNSTNNIQMLDLATGDVATLFTSAGWAYYATVSPDEKTLALSYSPAASSNSSPNRSLYVMPLDKVAKPQPLFVPPSPDDHYTQVEWSPDGKYIYFVHYNHNDSGGQFYEVYEIFRMSYPNGAPQKILDHAYWPRLSTDGNKLVYVTLDPSSGLNELYTANADGSNPQKVAFTGPWIPDVIDAPVFLPDGKTILFSAPGPVASYQPNWFEKMTGVQVAEAHSIPSDWWSVSTNGGTPTRLTSIETINLFAAISPDQKHIASLSGDGIFVMDMDGSNLTKVISDPGVHGTVSWVP
jgi:Tol biopolymer transport system component